MRMRKLASLSAAAALAIGGASLMGGCQASNGDYPRSSSGGTYDNDASTAGSRTGADEGGVDRSRNGTGNDTGSGSGTYGTGGSGSGTSGASGTSGGTNGNDT